MINSELNTPLRFYNDITKQNRYKENCAATCNYKLISRNDQFLPFQIRTDIDNFPAPLLTKRELYCADDNSLVADITFDLAGLSFQEIDGVMYIIYEGGDIISPVLDCGAYYIKFGLTDLANFPTIVNSYYSEVFNVVDFEEETEDENLPIFTAWRWYDNIDKQTRYKGNCSASCDYYIISNNTGLLPFMFKKNIDFLVVTSWVLRAVDESCEVVLDPSLLQLANFGEEDYLYYDGTPIDGLPCGAFYSIITMTADDGAEREFTFYSELIKLVEITSSDTPGNYILQENGFKILQETGFGLLQE